MEIENSEVPKDFTNDTSTQWLIFAPVACSTQNQQLIKQETCKEVPDREGNGFFYGRLEKGGRQGLRKDKVLDEVRLFSDKLKACRNKKMYWEMFSIRKGFPQVYNDHHQLKTSPLHY